MKKTLIYMDANILTPIGGQIGYCYNIQEELKKKKNSNIFFVKEEKKEKTIWRRTSNQIKSKKIKNLLVALKNIYKYGSMFIGERKLNYLNIDQYDIIHFHTTYDIYNLRKPLKNFKGKILLTTHCPQAPFLEILDFTPKWSKKIFFYIFDHLYKMDKYAFERADFILFPCKEAEEPYYHTWDEYSTIHENNRNKYRYLPTGCVSAYAKESREIVRKRYGIPLNSIVISYVGRHNYIKGFDILKKIAAKLLEENENMYFLIAGDEAPIKGLKHERWIEVGWTDDPYSIINSSDIFALPNRETYFDLVMLEVLSLGKPILASNTGGNKFFKNNVGVILFDDFIDGINKLKDLINKPASELEELGKINKKFFGDNLTTSIFLENYIDLLENL